MKIILISLLTFTLLGSSCIQNAQKNSIREIVTINGSEQFFQPKMDSVIISIDIDYPMDSSLISNNIRNYIITTLLYPNHDSISNLPMPDLKDSILNRLYVRWYLKPVTMKDKIGQEPRRIHNHRCIKIIESGVPSIRTFNWKEKEEIYVHGILDNTIESSNYSSISIDGKGISLLDIVNENSIDKVLSLLRSKIEEYCISNDKAYSDEAYSDLILTTSICIINKKLHCEMKWGLPEDFEIDIPLVDLQEYLSIDIH